MCVSGTGLILSFVCACDLHVHGLNSVCVGEGGLVLQGENPGGNLRGPSN